MKNARLIYEIVSGSRLYGTHNENSDYDYRGISLLPVRDMLNPFQGFKQEIDGTEEDRTVYHLPEFVRLASQGNPNIVELLFPNSENIIRMTSAGFCLIENRDLFISKAIVKTFWGYAESQLKRIQSHKSYLLNPPDHKPTRKEFGLPDAPYFGLEKINAVILAPIETISPEWREYVIAEKQYRSKMEEWDKYEAWKKGRNEVRRDLEKEFGYDTKFAMHVFRLLTEGEQLLVTGKIVFPLFNRDFLKDIRNGKYSYENLLEFLEIYKENFNSAEKSSPLKNKVDQNKILEVYNDIVFGKV